MNLVGITVHSSYDAEVNRETSNIFPLGAF